MRAALGAALLVAALPGPARAALSPYQAAHTVSWYRANPSAMQQMHEVCSNDRTYENYPDCKNAAAAGDSMVVGSSGQALSKTEADDPETYRSDPLQRRIVLAECKSSTPPPPAMCRAAAVAEAPGY